MKQQLPNSIATFFKGNCRN